MIVRLIRSAPVTDASWQGIYDDVVEGWLTFVQQGLANAPIHPLTQSDHQISNSPNKITKSPTPQLTKCQDALTTARHAAQAIQPTDRVAEWDSSAADRATVREWAPAILAQAQVRDQAVEVLGS